MPAVHTQIGPYEVQRELGRGGMGVVYLARDSRLEREVAIKALPEQIADDPERLARFKREAKLLASLQHSNIAAIHGMEILDERVYLILEYVAGETLAERIRRGVPPLEETLRIAKDIAEGIEAAHSRNIIHRDLKPANIKLTDRGQVKVLDFGLAKALEPPAVLSEEILPSATRSLGGGPTVSGMVMGTPGYMSPEQVRGEPATRQSDIWAFGCILFELLSGIGPFCRATMADSIAATLNDEPPSATLLSNCPESVLDLVRKCLSKNTRNRLHDIADVRIELEEALDHPEAATVLDLGSATARTLHLCIALPRGLIVAPDYARPLNISSNGLRVAYVGRGSSGEEQIYVRSLEQSFSREISGTDGSMDPFFSPDGRSLGFIKDHQYRSLELLSLDNGTSIHLSNVQTMSGSLWAADGYIWFSNRNPNARPQPSCIMRIPAKGGEPVAMTSVQPSSEQNQHCYPVLLPDGKTLLFTAFSSAAMSLDNCTLEAQSLVTGERKTLLHGAVYARYVRSGHLVFGRGRSACAVRFDPQRIEITGSEHVVLDDIQGGDFGIPRCAFSDNGTLVYLSGRSFYDQKRRLVQVDRNGKAAPFSQNATTFFAPRLSPDGSRLAFTKVGRYKWDIWILDIRRDTVTRLTFGESDSDAAWSPDGKWIYFTSQPSKGVSCDLCRIRSDGSGERELLISTGTNSFPDSVTPDGNVLFYTTLNPQTDEDIMMLPLDGTGKPQPFLQTPFKEYGARISPDGNWVAYVSKESGECEVYVRPVNGRGGKYQVSSDGGASPIWSAKGRELFYRKADKLMAARIKSTSPFTCSPPRPLFRGDYEEFGRMHTPWNYDVMPDGKRFIMVVNEDEQASNRINVVLNWFEDLKRRVPV